MKVYKIEAMLLAAAGLILAGVMAVRVISDPGFDPRYAEKEQSERLLSENKQAVLENMGSWIMFWRRMRPGFSWLNIKGAGEERMRYVHSGRWEGETEDKKNLYKKSPDNRYLADVYGGWADAEITERERIREPEQKWVDVADLDSGKYMRILACGPECGVTHAKWIDSNRLAIGIWRRSGECESGCKVAPILEIYDFSRNIKTKFYSDTETEEKFLKSWYPSSQSAYDLMNVSL